MEYNLTLVLGAGSSLAMGYPLGTELTRAIIEDSLGVNRDLICDRNEGIEEDQLEDFIDAFQKSQQFSIDAFLSKRFEYANIGKRAIAAALLSRENKESLFNCNHNDHWYQYLLNRITLEPDWQKLSLSRIAIITFNYDRSLEHYLISALMHSYAKSQEQAEAKVSEMKIVHVYGTLGEIFSSKKHYFYYGRSPDRQQITAAASMLKVIPEGRDEDITLQEARRVLLNSTAIGFLGFGFDELNLKRLNSTETCRSLIKANGANYINRTIAATCYGMTYKEREKAAELTKNANHNMITKDDELYFIQCNCTRLLRETLILDNI